MAMANAVKVDVETHRLIGDLAHALGRTRKDVLRDAVQVFASVSGAALDGGLDGAAQRIALAGIRGAAARHAEARDAEDLPVRSARVAAALVSDEVFAAMSPRERLEARRAEVERRFAERGAHDPRFVDPTVYGYLPEHLVIAVRLDESTTSRVCMELSSWLWAVVEIDAFVVQAVDVG